MPFKCSLCDYVTAYRTDVINHHNKKIKCSENFVCPEIIEIKEYVYCSICNRKFSNNYSRNKHIINCEIKQSIKKIIELEREVGSLKEKLTINNTTNNNTTNTTNNSNNTNNININIITPYNNPNQENIKEYIENSLKRIFLSVPYLIEQVHFNDKHPENKNICITNKRGKDAKVFNGEKWVTIKKDKLINGMIDSFEREIIDYAEENGKNKFLKDYKSAKNRGNAEKDLADEVHNVIYDNSFKVDTKINELLS